jgi:tRNA U55 pseudouridine synthase TruB
MDDLSGILPIDKPVGMTSHDVVDVIRRPYGTKRLAHNDTLNRDLVVLEFHGDHSARIADALFELRLSAGRKVTFLLALLPAELKEALL